MANELLERDKRRLRIGVTVQAVVDEADIARSTYDRLLAGKHEPNLRTLRLIDRALDHLERQAAATPSADGAASDPVPDTSPASDDPSEKDAA